MPFSWAAARPPCYLDTARASLADGQARGPEALPQGHALEKLGHEIGGALVLTDLVDCENVWMIQSARGAGLLLETLQALGIAGPVRMQHLQGHLAP